MIFAALAIHRARIRVVTQTTRSVLSTNIPETPGSPHRTRILDQSITAANTV
jgi:hypothetical protein